MMDYGAGLGFGFGGPLALLGCVLLAVGAVVLIAWAAGRFRQPVAPSQATGSPGPGPVSQDAVDVLRLRFARGELTAEEFVAAKQVLEGAR